jgi:hypothetical protein
MSSEPATTHCLRDMNFADRTGNWNNQQKWVQKTSIHHYAPEFLNSEDSSIKLWLAIWPQSIWLRMEPQPIKSKENYQENGWLKWKDQTKKLTWQFCDFKGLHKGLDKKQEKNLGQRHRVKITTECRQQADTCNTQNHSAHGFWIKFCCNSQHTLLGHTLTSMGNRLPSS